ncbi:MAG: 30S ribosomal protein S4 [Mycoplasmataceae bacterium]|jgi:small subunit ribosomal protein S4|nr:30S ribosomal protein S4 [Mycoplasmataceae bacterium]
MSHSSSTYIVKNKLNKRKNPIFKRSRRLGFSLLENDKEFTQGKKKRRYAPGQHGQKRGRASEYKVQLTEKQKVASLYGMNDKQLKRFIVNAIKMEGSTSLNFLHLLESRLDNLVFCMGFAPTRRAARQLVSHRHILVNGKIINIPSYICKPGDNISVKLNSKDIKYSGYDVQAANVKPFVNVDIALKSGVYSSYPELTQTNQGIDIAQVIEYYNKLL